MGERRQLTVLFCDLVGSTPLSQQLDPEEYPVLVRRYHEAASAVVTRYGGHVANDLGDGLLVYFGWPQAFDDAAERAARAGLQLIETVRALDAPVRLAVRVGIHTGDVVLAEIDGVARPETLGLGQTTNLAARLQAVAAPDTVVVSEATLRLMAGIFVTEDLGAQTLKGIATPVGTWRLVQPSGVRSRLEVDPARLTPFVGRDMELETLVDRWERAADGAGETVLVVAEPGVGKSRLAYQLRERLAAISHTWLECRATPYTQGTPFFPVIELVAQRLTLTAEDSDPEKIGKIERALAFARIAPAEAVPLLADFLGLPAPAGYAPLAMGPEVQRRRTMELLTAWTLALAEGQPLVLLIEDLHWCDPSSLDLFGRVITQSATARILLVGTARPEFVSPWPARSNLTTLQLARLTKRQAREMIGALAARSLSVEMIDALVARADGVPLYVEELMKGMADPDLVRGVDAIPATLAGLLMARLDRLSTAKGVAQRAAVLGREFGYPLLAAVAGMDDAGLRQGLARLVDAEIVFQRGEPPEATYTFKHALVQEAAYESLLKGRRRELHGATARALAERYPDTAETQPELLAVHYTEAGEAEHAVAAWERAGTRARARGALGEALSHLRRGLAVLATLPESPARDEQEFRLQLPLAQALMMTQAFASPEVAEALARARVLGAKLRDPGQVVLLLCSLTASAIYRDGPGAAQALADQALAVAEQAGRSSLLVLAHNAQGMNRFFAGDLPGAREHCGRALAARPRDDTRIPTHRIATLPLAAMVAWHLGLSDEARRYAHEAGELAERARRPADRASAETNVTFLHVLLREPAAVREHAERAACAETESMARPSGTLMVVRGWALAQEGQTQEGLAVIHAGLERFRASGQRFNIEFHLGLLADAHAGAGNVAEALSVLADAEGAVPGEEVWRADTLRRRAELLARAGRDTATVEATFEEALTVARRQRSKAYEFRAATRYARFLCGHGHATEARALLAPLYASFTEGFDTRDLIEAKALLDELR